MKPFLPENPTASPDGTSGLSSEQVTYADDHIMTADDIGKRVRFTAAATLTIPDGLGTPGARSEIYAQGGSVNVEQDGDTEVIVEGQACLLVLDAVDTWLLTDLGGVGEFDGTEWVRWANSEAEADALPAGMVAVVLGDPIDDTPPNPPSALVLTPGSGQIAAAWAAGTDDVAVDHHEIRWWPSGGPYTGWAEATTNTGQTITGLTTGVLYVVEVRCVDTSGNASTVIYGSATPT